MQLATFSVVFGSLIHCFADIKHPHYTRLRQASKHSSLSELELKSLLWFTATTKPINQGESTGEARIFSC